jgi:hypothetical protein
MGSTRQLDRIATAVEQLQDAPTPRNTAHEDRHAKLPMMASLILWWGGSEKQLRGFVRDVRSWPIVAFVGPNGGGKTLCLVAASRPTRQGITWRCDNPDHLHTQRGIFEGQRLMLSTVPIYDPDTGELHPLYVKWERIEQFVEIEHADVYADEVVNMASSRESQRMDARMLSKLVQLRKCDVLFFWSAPNWARADKVMREVTQLVVECRGWYPLAPVDEDEVQSIWRPKRVFQWRAYDAMEFEEWTASKRESIEPESKVWFRGPGSEAFRAYDTTGSVSILQGMTPENTCTVCEGTITRHRCQCKQPASRRARREGSPSHELELAAELGAPSEHELADA